MVNAFLEAADEDGADEDALPIRSAAQVRECFAVLRRIAKQRARAATPPISHRNSSAEFVDAVEGGSNAAAPSFEAEEKLVRRIKSLEEELEAERAASNANVENEAHPENGASSEEGADDDDDEPEYVSVGINPIQKSTSAVSISAKSLLKPPAADEAAASSGFDALLKRGGVFIKHGRRGRPHPGTCGSPPISNL